MRTYRPYVPGEDDEAVLKLRSQVWGATHRHTNVAFLRWLYADLPSGRGSGIVMCEKDEVLGFAGLLARRALVGGETRLIAQCVDYMVHGDARAGASPFRIMSSWARLARDLGFHFGIGFPNASSHTLVTRQKLGWTDAFWADHMIRPLSSDGAPLGLVPRLPTCAARAATAAIAGLCRVRAALSCSARPPGSVVSLDGFDSGADRLWQRACSGPYSGIQRDAAYLNWRYLLHPLYSYQRIGWQVDGRLVGWMVVAERELFSVPSLLLVDLLVEPTAPDGVIDALIAHLTGRNQAARFPMIHALAMPNSRIQTTLLRAGFIKIARRINPKPFVMTAHDLVAASPRDRAWADWNFNWGDMDVV